jgi:hypothetical protein
MTHEELDATEAQTLEEWASAWALRIESEELDARPDGLGDWGDGANHWRVALYVTAPGDATERLLWSGPYSQGAAFRMWTPKGIRAARRAGYGVDRVEAASYRPAAKGEPVHRTEANPTGGARVELVQIGPRVSFHFGKRDHLAMIEAEEGHTRAELPEALSVLECILSDAMSAADSVPFVEWAGELGYELADYEKAHAAYLACQATYRTALSALGRAELERVGWELER